MSSYERVVQEIADEIQVQANWQDLLETALDGLRNDVVERLAQQSDRQQEAPKAQEDIQ